MKNDNRPATYKRCLSAFTAASLLLVPMVSLAASTSAVVKGGALNLRNEASINAKVLGQYPTGTLVEILTSGDTWHKVQVNGQTGYMMAKYLNTGSSETSSTATVRTNSDRGLNLRDAPSANGAIITSYKTGTSVKVIQRGSNWSRVEVDGKEGYMSTAFLSFGGGSTGGGGGGSTTVAKAIVNNPKDTQVLNLRATASLDAKVLAYYKNGVEVNVLSKGKTWSEVKVNGIHGYMMTKYLKFTGESGENVTTPFAATLKNINGGSIVNFRKAPGMNTTILRTYPVGTKVTVQEMGVNWSKVEIDGVEGYVSTYFLKY